MLAAAPYFHEVAPGPAARAFWLRAADGLRIRAALWGDPATARDTVLLFPGRTEYVEKYGGVARDLVARGFAVLSVDWRGQGLADRMTPDAALGHVGRFSDYQLDVAALAGLARDLALPQPWSLLAHSMGGAIGLRAMIDANLPLRRAVFTAPMWGIAMSPAMRPVARLLPRLARRAGCDAMLTPGQKRENYVTFAPFAGNQLTTDPDHYEMMRRQLAAHPEMALGGPTMRWLAEALDELDRLAALPAPPQPALCWLGGNEAIVDPRPIRARMAAWPAGKLADLPGIPHEVLMERPATRDRVIAESVAFLRG